MGTANILIVCEEDEFLSPAAGFLLVDRLGPAAREYSIRTAGVNAVAGSLPDPAMRTLLGRRGLEVTGSVSHELTADLVDSADLILTASTSHRAAVVRVMPRAVRKTLTLKQFARYAPFVLTSGDGPPAGRERVGWILAALPQARSQAPKGEDSIEGPRGRSPRHCRRVLDELDRACATVASILREPATSSTASVPVESWWTELSASDPADASVRPQMRRAHETRTRRS